MGLLDKPYRDAAAFRDQAVSALGARVAAADQQSDWPEGERLVFADEVALELGSPGVGSVFALLWSDTEAVVDGRVTLLGPDVGEGSKALRQLFFVRAAPGDDYQLGCALKDAVFDTRLAGVTVRAMPSRQTMWLRVSRDAVRDGFSLVQWGAEVIWRLRDVPGVMAAEALFVTGDAADVRALDHAAAEAGRLVAAMNKMNEEMDFDCTSCEYWDVCATVEQLKKQRAALQAERKP